LSGKLDPNYHIGKKSAAPASAASSSTPAPAPSAPGKYPGGALSPPFIELSDSSSDGETVSAQQEDEQSDDSDGSSSARSQSQAPEDTEEAE